MLNTRQPLITSRFHYARIGMLFCVAQFLVFHHFEVASAAEAPMQFAKISPSVLTFLQKNCVVCHGPKEQNASIRFDTIPSTVGDEAIAQRWQDVLDVLNLSQMPPEDAKQPSKQELSDVLESLTANILEAKQRLNDSGGQIVLRRLNRREYRNTIESLFGVPVDTSMLPDDSKLDGFDTVGSVNSFSSLHLERYLSLGRDVLDQVLPTKKPKHHREYQNKHEESEKRALEYIKKELPGLEKKVAGYDKTIKEGKKEHLYRQGISRKEVELSKEYLAREETKSGVLIPFRGLNPNTHIDLWKPPTGKYRITIRCGSNTESSQSDMFLKVVRGQYRSKVPDDVTFYQVTGTFAEPQTIEFFVEVDNLLANRFELHRRHHRYKQLPKHEKARDYYFKYPELTHLEEDTQADLWIDWVEMEGPLKIEPAPPLYTTQILGGMELKDVTDQNARGIIERFAFEAFRHQQPEAEYINKLMSIYTASREHQSTIPEALKDAFTVVLATPRFLFMVEPRSAEEKSRPLTDLELAVRLSYFFWSAPPDAELYSVAENGNLRNPKILLEQVDRMIASSKSRTFIETFSTQWLELDRLDAINPSAAHVDQYDEAVHKQSKQEVFEFINHLLQEDLPATNLLDSNFAVVNSLMSQFYHVSNEKFPQVQGDAFQSVKLPENSIRGGLLGQSAILTLTGTGDRTSPVERGVYVLRKLMNRPPPPAPANVPMLDEETIGERSIQQTLAMHQTKAQCASCHRRIDPIGFSLENFSPVGLWREEVKSSDGSKSFAIETSGVMPDGTRKFENFHEMKRHLSVEQDAMLTGLTKALMTYALGRAIGFTDQETVAQIVQETTQEKYGFKTLVHNIVSSKPFLTK